MPAQSPSRSAGAGAEGLLPQRQGEEDEAGYGAQRSGGEEDDGAIIPVEAAVQQRVEQVLEEQPGQKWLRAGSPEAEQAISHKTAKNRSIACCSRYWLCLAAFIASLRQSFIALPPSHVQINLHIGKDVGRATCDSMASS